MTQTLEPLLVQHRFFHDLEPRYIQLLVRCAANVRFQTGDFLFREGQEANRFYLLRYGAVTLETFAPAPGPLTIQTLNEGDVLGWSWLFPPYRWQFDARAATLVRAIALDGTCLRRKCEEDSALGYEMLKRFSRIIIERLQATRMQLLDVYGGPS
jgi:CRP/FNR family transcriptional regulator, cyclic AMP receptor protein